MTNLMLVRQLNIYYLITIRILESTYKKMDNPFSRSSKHHFHDLFFRISMIFFTDLINSIIWLIKKNHYL